MIFEIAHKTPQKHYKIVKVLLFEFKTNNIKSNHWNVVYLYVHIKICKIYIMIYNLISENNTIKT